MITNYSNQQKKVLTWWMEGSPMEDRDMIIAEGAIRSGKTVSTIESFINWSLVNFTDCNFIIAGVSINTVKRNVLDPLFTLLRMKGIDYQWKMSQSLLLIGENRYYVFGANTDYSQDAIQGLTAAGSFIDEAPLIPRSFVEQAMGRCSVEGAKNWFTLNPSTPFHWFKTEMIDKAEERNAFVLHFKMTDNPSLSEAVQERYKRMFTGVFYQRYIEGMWVVAEGAIYDMFNKDKHVKEAPTSPTYYDASWCAIDYATSSVMTFGLYGIKDGVVHLIKEYYWNAKERQRQKTDVEYADDLKDFLDGWNVVAIYIDPSASSFQATLRKRNFKKVRNAKNDVVNGIRTVATKIQSNEFLIDPSCVDTLKEIESYSWDRRAQELGEDRPLKKNDHAMDRDRYAIYSYFKKHVAKPVTKPRGF